jgi:hypothetical protein
VAISGRERIMSDLLAARVQMGTSLIVFGIGALFLLPSLWFLYTVFKADLPGAVDAAPQPAGRVPHGSE